MARASGEAGSPRKSTTSAEEGRATVGAGTGVAGDSGASVTEVVVATAGVGAVRAPPSVGSARAAEALTIKVIATADIASSEAAATTRSRAALPQ
ncbi:hypothetical protein [Mitsuaria sp. PDC51]|uniref:hypothetical protein n=1 Tax=Mitsuaria sp. PDC51 TaxID=1881035 RepID=UPI0020C91E13|nr:hypothetical protein [Mitsuaria sp. PDC51]